MKGLKRTCLGAQCVRKEQHNAGQKFHERLELHLPAETRRSQKQTPGARGARGVTPVKTPREDAARRVEPGVCLCGGLQELIGGAGLQRLTTLCLQAAASQLGGAT